MGEHKAICMCDGEGIRKFSPNPPKRVGPWWICLYKKGAKVDLNLEASSSRFFTTCSFLLFSPLCLPHTESPKVFTYLLLSVFSFVFVVAASTSVPPFYAPSFCVGDRKIIYHTLISKRQKNFIIKHEK